MVWTAPPWTVFEGIRGVNACLVYASIGSRSGSNRASMGNSIVAVFFTEIDEG
jgi:hypothetical protein